MNIKELLIKEDIWQEDCPGVLQTGSLLSYAFIKQNKHLQKKCQKTIIVLGREGYVWELSVIKDKNCVFDALNKKGVYFLKKKVKEWKNHRAKCLKFMEEISAEKIKKFSNKKLADIYEKFFDMASTSWSYPIMGEGCDPFSTYELIPALQKNLRIKESEAREIAITLSQSSVKSFFDEEKLSLLKIALMKGAEFSEAVKEHAKKYYWIRNNYLETNVLNKDYFLREVQDIRKNKTKKEIITNIKRLESYEAGISEKKKDIRKKYNIDKDLDKKIIILEIMSWWIDQRKAMMEKFFHIIFTLLKELSMRANLDFDLSKYLLRKEVNDILIKNKSISEEKMKKRRKANVYFLDSNFNEHVIEGKKANEIIDAYLNKLSQKEIKGITASMGSGNIKARASIVMDVNKNKFVSGSVLVTSMTRPEFIPLMRKASAIVTDEGGITCHAAIISRELGIPCIIATKVATRVLKNNDLIEINVKNGVVRKLR